MIGVAEEVFADVSTIRSLTGDLTAAASLKALYFVKKVMKAVAINITNTPLNKLYRNAAVERLVQKMIPPATIAAASPCHNE
jgi:hypothetical protein